MIELQSRTMSKEFESLIRELSVSESTWKTPIYCKGITTKNELPAMYNIGDYLERQSTSVFSFLHSDSGFAFDPSELKGINKKDQLLFLGAPKNQPICHANTQHS